MLSPHAALASVDAAPFSVTPLPKSTVYGPPAFATGAWFPWLTLTSTVADATLAGMLSSVTVSLDVYDPKAWYAWLVTAPFAVVPSPYSQA